MATDEARRSGSGLLFGWIRGAAATAALVFLLGGCAHHQVGPGIPQPYAPLEAPSFGAFEDLEVDGVPLAEHLAARTFRITGNLRPVGERRGSGEPTGLEKVDDSEGITFGWAIPLSEDGYFLTAAHIIERSPRPLFLLGRLPGGEVLVEPLRVVFNSWQGLDTEELSELIPTDVAVVHVTARVPVTVRWAEPWELRPGTGLAAVGGERFWPPEVNGGRLIQTRPGVRAPGTGTGSQSIGTLVLIHDALEGYGGSGAPVMLNDGRLAGMTIGGGNWDVPVSLLDGERPEGVPDELRRIRAAAALYPDPDALERVISRDRRRMADET